eukprot:363755-Chlamydomonas_euryale.AAC.8
MDRRKDPLRVGTLPAPRAACSHRLPLEARLRHVLFEEIAAMAPACSVGALGETRGWGGMAWHGTGVFRWCFGGKRRGGAWHGNSVFRCRRPGAVCGRHKAFHTNVAHKRAAYAASCDATCDAVPTRPMNLPIAFQT